MTTLARLAGQLLSVGFEGTAAGDELRARIAASEVGGVMLFRPNIASPGQLAALVADAAGGGPGRPAAAGVDRPGGGPGAAAARARPPSGRRCCRSGGAGDAARTPAVGRALGEELAAVGVGWNFAPVLDVHTNPANPVIGNRAFGTTPEAVARHALAFWRGLRAAGLVGCGKHYPGHGDTRDRLAPRAAGRRARRRSAARRGAGAVRGGGAPPAWRRS